MQTWAAVGVWVRDQALGLSGFLKVPGCRVYWKGSSDLDLGVGVLRELIGLLFKWSCVVWGSLLSADLGFRVPDSGRLCQHCAALFFLGFKFYIYV